MFAFNVSVKIRIPTPNGVIVTNDTFTPKGLGKQPQWNNVYYLNNNRTLRKSEGNPAQTKQPIKMNSALLKDSAGSVLGYIFDFASHGAFAPSGKVEGITPEIGKAHNDALAALELEAAKQNGRAVFYICNDNAGRAVVQQWSGAIVAYPFSIRKSWHNMAGRDGRTDIDFGFAGSRWHGVNIGDNQILRCKCCKK